MKLRILLFFLMVACSFQCNTVPEQKATPGFTGLSEEAKRQIYKATADAMLVLSNNRGRSFCGGGGRCYNCQWRGRAAAAALLPQTIGLLGWQVQVVAATIAYGGMAGAAVGIGAAFSNQCLELSQSNTGYSPC